MDGRWRWTGQAWVPTAPVQTMPTPLGFGDVIALPTRDRRWFGKCGIEGLIALIPIYGAFEIVGWSLTYLDNLRAGRLELPEARFGYASRGARPALVALIYTLVAIVLFYGVLGGALFALIQLAPPSSTTGPNATAGSSSGGPFPVLFFVGIFALQAVFLLLYALAHFLVVPVILRTERYGIGAGLKLWGAVKMATEDLRTAAVAAVLIFLAAFFSGLGVYVCVVGVVFSYGYAAAMLGATVRWYEERHPVRQV